MNDLEVANRELVEENSVLRTQLANARDELANRLVLFSYGWLVLCALPVVALIAFGYEHRWTSDDSFIDFRVVQQILAGHGPVYNLGQRVEVFTSPLWLAALTVFGGLSGHIELSAVILGI